MILARRRQAEEAARAKTPEAQPPVTPEPPPAPPEKPAAPPKRPR